MADLPPASDYGPPVMSKEYPGLTTRQAEQFKWYGSQGNWDTMIDERGEIVPNKRSGATPPPDGGTLEGGGGLAPALTFDADPVQTAKMVGPVRKAQATTPGAPRPMQQPQSKETNQGPISPRVSSSGQAQGQSAEGFQPLEVHQSTWAPPQSNFRMFDYDPFTPSHTFQGEFGGQEQQKMSPEQLQGNIKNAQMDPPKSTYGMKNESQRSQIEGPSANSKNGKGSGMNLLGQRIQQMSLAIQETRYKTLFSKRVEKMIGGQRGRLQ